MTPLRLMAVFAIVLVVASGSAVRAQTATPDSESEALNGDSEELTSLLFSGVEATLIERALRARVTQVGIRGRAAGDQLDEDLFFGLDEKAEEQPAAAPEARPVVLHFSAIMYISPRIWTVWLNGQRFSPDRWPEHVEALGVERDSIELTLRVTEGAAPVTVRLRPNQTYIVATGEVVEGAPRGVSRP